MNNSCLPLESLIDIGWIIQGAVVGGANVILVVAIINYEALRNAKQYLILMGLALADAINMTANLTGGVYRLFFIPEGPLTARQCLLRPHFMLTMFSENLCTVMLSVVAFDRLLFMLRPLQYLTRKVCYAQKLLLVTYSLLLSFGAINIAIAFGANGPGNLLDGRCMPMQFVGNAALVGRVQSILYLASIPLCAILSVVVMFFSWPIYMFRQAKLKGVMSQARQLKRQKAFTKSIAISTCCTLFLYVFPTLLAIHSHMQGKVLVALTCKFILGFNALGNVIIYQLGHRETRKAVASLFKCKEMPPNIDLWNPRKPLPRVKMCNRVHPL